jgi:dynein heavy chain
VEGRFPAALFADEVVQVASRLVPMTINLWNRTQVRILRACLKQEWRPVTAT